MALRKTILVWILRFLALSSLKREQFFFNNGIHLKNSGVEEVCTSFLKKRNPTEPCKFFMVCTDGSTLMAHVPVPCGYIVITASTRWAPSTTWAALPLHTDWTGRSLLSYISVCSLPMLVSYWRHHGSSKICWL